MKFMPDVERPPIQDIQDNTASTEFSKSFELVTAKTEKSRIFKRSRSVGCDEEFASISGILKKPSTSSAVND